MNNLEDKKGDYLDIKARTEDMEGMDNEFEALVEIYDQGQYPTTGPLSKANAERISLIIPEDYTMPLPFRGDVIIQRVREFFTGLKPQLEALKIELKEKKEAFDKLAEQYAQEEAVENAATNSAEVISAKAELASGVATLGAAQIKADADREMMRTGMAALVLIIVTIVVLKIFKVI